VDVATDGPESGPVSRRPKPTPQPKPKPTPAISPVRGKALDCMNEMRFTRQSCHRSPMAVVHSTKIWNSIFKIFKKKLY